MRRAAVILVASLAALTALSAALVAFSGPLPTWSVPINGRPLAGQPHLTLDGLVVVRTGGDGLAGGALLAFDAATGRRRYEAPDPDPGTEEIHFGGRVAFTLARKVEATVVRLFDLTNGKERWAARLAPGSGRHVHRFLADEASLSFEEPHGEDIRLVALDAATGRRIGQWNHALDDATGRAVPVYSDAGSWVLFDALAGQTVPVPGGEPDALSGDGAVLSTRHHPRGRTLWNITDPTRPAVLLEGVPGGGFAQLSHDGRRVLVVHNHDDHNPTLYSRAVGRPEGAWTYPMRAGTNGIRLSADGRFALVNLWRPVTPPVVVETVLLDLQQKREVLTLPQTPAPWFTPDSRWVFVRGGGHWSFLDPVSGSEGLRLSAKAGHATLTHHGFAGGRWCHTAPPEVNWWSWWQARAESCETLVCHDLASLQVLARVPVESLWRVATADDGSFLLTLEGEGEVTRLRRWEVPARRPWAWGACLCLSAGAVAVGLWAFWPRRRGRQKSDGREGVPGADHEGESRTASTPPML